MTLKIVVVSATTLVPDSGTITRLTTTLSSLTKLDDVEVHVTALESPRLLAKRALVWRRRYAMEAIGVSMSFLPLIPQRLPGGRSTMVAAASRILAPSLRAKRPDILVALNADAASACSQATKRLKATCYHVFEMHGIESEEAIFAGTLARDSVAHARRQEIETSALDWADAVVAPTQEACEWGQSVSSTPTDWHALPSLSTMSLTDEEVSHFRSASRQSLGWADKKVLLYIGGMNEWQEPKRMLSCFSELLSMDSDWRFLVITQDTERARELTGSYGLAPHSYRIAAVPHDEVARHAAAGDIALLLRKRHLMNSAASPTKFNEYLEMGVPLCLTEALPSMAELTADYRVGIVVGTEASANTIATNVRTFMSGVDRLAVSGQLGKLPPVISPRAGQTRSTEQLSTTPGDESMPDTTMGLPHSCRQLAGKSILITGGAGTIGSRLAKTLAPYASVTVLDDLSSGNVQNLPDGVRFVNGSILEPRNLREALGRQTDAVFHLAALFANQNSVEHPEQDLRVNGMGTLRVLETALDAGVESIVYASSSCVYGSQPGELFEHQVPGPLDTPYAITKYLGELYSSYFAEQAAELGTRLVNIRYFNVYGPGELPGPYRNVIPNFIAAALEGRALTITGTGEETRDFTFVDDAVLGTMLAAVAGQQGESYNIGTGRPTTILDLANTLLAATGSTSELIFKKRRNWDSISHRRASNEKAREHLGYEPLFDIEQGILQTVQWLENQL